MSNKLIKNILSDLRVELSDEFDRNFERKAFFDRPWPKRKRDVRGSLLMNSGRLRRSLRCSTDATSLKWTSDTPYAGIHNGGGEITITPRMRKFFWAMYYKSIGDLSYNRKTKKVAVGRHNTKLTADALFWRNMALTKKSKITMPQRQFIGYHNHVGEVTDKVVKENIEAFLKNIKP